MRCSVATCSNSSQKAKKSGVQISFRSFLKNPKIRKEWVIKCKREGEWNPDSCHICSEHFIPDDFKRDLQAELLGHRPIRRLHADAVPSLNLPSLISEPVNPSAAKQRERYHTRYSKELHKRGLRLMEAA